MPEEPTDERGHELADGLVEAVQTWVDTQPVSYPLITIMGWRGGLLSLEHGFTTLRRLVVVVEFAEGPLTKGGLESHESDHLMTCEILNKVHNTVLHAQRLRREMDDLDR